MTEALHQRPTPHLVVDADVLEANVTAMAAFARDRGVALRPHAKTHKSPRIAELQLASGATGLSVATVAEAEVFADSGFDDLFIAYTVWVDAARGSRLRSLTDRVRLTVGVDSVEGARALATHVPGAAVLIEVECGHRRSGVAPADAGALAEVAQHAGLDVRGVFTFPGHSYSPGAAPDVAAQESSALRSAATSLSQRGIEPRVVSGGSTPSVAAADTDVLTELRPGVYVFGDAQQWELGTTQPSHIALTCLATVVGHAGGRLVLDSGSKALGADRPTWATGWGRLLDYPDARIGLLSEHHAVVDWTHQELPPMGSRLRVVPNHVCNAVNLADELVVVRGSTVTDIWPVAARGGNT